MEKRTGPITAGAHSKVPPMFRRRISKAGAIDPKPEDGADTKPEDGADTSNVPPMIRSSMAMAAPVSELALEVAGKAATIEARKELAKRKVAAKAPKELARKVAGGARATKRKVPEEPEQPLQEGKESEEPEQPLQEEMEPATEVAAGAATTVPRKESEELKQPLQEGKEPAREVAGGATPAEERKQPEELKQPPQKGKAPRMVATAAKGRARPSVAPVAPKPQSSDPSANAPGTNSCMDYIYIYIYMEC